MTERKARARTTATARARATTGVLHCVQDDGVQWSGEGAVGPEVLVGYGLDEVEAAGEEALGFELVLVLGEEPLAFALAPAVDELLVADEDVGGVGVAGTPEEGLAFAVLAAAGED